MSTEVSTPTAIHTATLGVFSCPRSRSGASTATSLTIFVGIMLYAVLLSACVTPSPMSPALKPQINAVTTSSSSYVSDNTTVTIDRFDAPGAAAHSQRPAILLLHGSDGMFAQSLRGDYYRAAARNLAAHGYTVFIPHYFNRTHQLFTGIDEIHLKVPAWTQTVQDALTYITTQPGVDARRIGVVGISLGGGLAFSLVQAETRYQGNQQINQHGTQKSRVRVIVDYFGFYPATLAPTTKLPPTLIVHGTADELVSIHYAERLEDQLKRLHTPYQKIIYPGLGHGLNLQARTESEAKALVFLNHYLSPTAPHQP